MPLNKTYTPMLVQWTLSSISLSVTTWITKVNDRVDIHHKPESYPSLSTVLEVPKIGVQ